MSKDFVYHTIWENSFLSPDDLRSFARFLSWDTPYEMHQFLNHPNLDERGFLFLFEKAKECNFFDPSRLNFLSNGHPPLKYNHDAPAAPITFSIFCHRYCPEEVIEEHVFKSHAVANDFLANTKSPWLMEYYDFARRFIDEPKSYFESKLVESVLKNPNCPVEFIDRHAEDTETTFLLSLVHPHCPARIVHQAFEQWCKNTNEKYGYFNSYFLNLSKSLLRNKNLDSAIVDTIAQRGVLQRYGGEILQHPNISCDVLKTLIEGIDQVLKSIEKNGCTAAEQSLWENLMDTGLKHPKLDDDFLAKYFFDYPVSVIENPNFHRWDDVMCYLEKLSVKDEGNHKRIFLESLFRHRMDAPCELVKKYERFVDAPHVLSHPMVSQDFLEEHLVFALNDDGQEMKWSREDILWNYSKNPGLSMANMLRFVMKADAPYGLFVNPAFGGMPQTMKEIILSNLMMKSGGVEMDTDWVPPAVK